MELLNSNPTIRIFEQGQRQDLSLHDISLVSNVQNRLHEKRAVLPRDLITPMASAASDLLDHFRLEAEVFPTYTSHVSYRSNRTHGTRKERVEKRWYKDKVLGHGSFGEVCLEVHRQGDIVADTRAVKKLDKAKMRIWKVDYEGELLALAKFSKAQYKEQDVLVKFFGFFESIDAVFLVMEYFPHGDLAQYLETPLEEFEVKQIAMDLLEGLKIMHAEGFTHRSLKPQNILVVKKYPEPWWVKIGDFGIAKRINEQTDSRMWASSPHYQAPEITGYIEELEESSIYTNAVDMWSLGCVIYTLSTKGEVPFPTSSAVNRYCNGRQHFPEEALSMRLTSMGVEFVKKLLVRLPSDRITAETALQAPWLQTGHGPLQRPLDSKTIDLEEPGVVNVLEASVPSSMVANNYQDVSFPQLPVALEPCTASGNLTMVLPTRELHETPRVQSMEPRSEPLDSWRKSSNSLRAARDDLAYKDNKEECSREEGGDGGRKYGLSVKDTQDKQRVASTSFRALSKTVLPPHIISTPDAESREAVLLLKDGGFDYSAAHYDPKAAWFWAAQHDHDIVVRLLLEKGADIDGKHNGLTALHHAVKYGHEAVTRLLLEKGADFERKDSHGLTPLHSAAANGNETVALMLLEKGADIEGKEYNGQTALHLAAQYGHETFVLLLLEEGADIERKNASGQTALHVAVNHGCETVIHRLLEKGADIEGKDKNGQTALHLAARAGYEVVSQLLLEKGADVTTRDRVGNTPSTSAVEKWQKGCSIVNLLQSPQWAKSPR